MVFQLRLKPCSRLTLLTSVSLLCSSWTLNGLAQETAVTLKGVSIKTLQTYKSATLIDAELVSEKTRQLKAGVEALVHMSEMISEAHARKAMKAQIDSLKATLALLDQQVQESAHIDYSFPAPLPLKRAPNQVHSTQIAPPSLVKEIKSETQTNESLDVQAMSATQLSRFWGAIERASFRNDKMAVIHQITREHYLSTQQAELFIESLTFSKDRRDAVKLLYPRLVDPDEIETLYRLLDQPAHRREVKKTVEQINMNRRMQREQGL